MDLFSLILRDIILALVLLSLWSPAWAKERGLGFVIDDKCEIRKVVLHTRKVFTLGKGFPFIEVPVAVSVTGSSSDRESVRMNFDSRTCFWISYDGYPLDMHRLVLNGHDVRGRAFLLVWDWRGNRLRTYQDAGSSSPESISGISFDERWAVSVPTDSLHGLIFHDLDRRTVTRLYDNLKAFSPRFSPDGTRWAFLSGNQLVIRSTKSGEEKKVPVPVKGKWLYSTHLAWAPSGRFIAGTVHHAGTDLVIWDSDGKPLKVISVPGAVTFCWPPIWAPDENGVYVVLGNEAVVGKWQPLQTRYISIR